MVLLIFLIKLNKILQNSDIYPMTKISVNFLLKSQRHTNDYRIILDAIRNDIIRNNKNDTLSLQKLWNDTFPEKRLQID